MKHCRVVDLQGLALRAALALFVGVTCPSGWAQAAVAAAANAPASVPLEDARNTRIVTTNTQQPLPVFTTLEAWEARKALLRSQILTAAGFSPLPEKTPLNAQVYGKIAGKDYTIEKVLLEPMPGFYLGGSLYRPANGRAKHPGIVNPQGHWGYGRLENQPLFSGPALGISLARQGYVVFSYDMVGYTDTLQLPHRYGNAEMRLWSFTPFAVQMWNAIRAVDFLVSLPDVDASDVGALGGSSGAGQSFMLASIDDRIQFTALVSMVSSFMQGGDICEGAPGLRIGTSNPEIAAFIAPKPMLLVAGTVDWTRNTLRDEFPAIQKLYKLYGKPENVEAVQVEAPHNFNLPSREAVYRFLDRIHPGLSDAKNLTEHDIAVPMVGELSSLWGRTLPADAVDLQGLYSAWKQRAAAQTAEIADNGFLRERMRRTLAVENPASVDAVVTGEKIAMTRGKGDRLAGVLLPGKGALAIVLDPGGAEAALKSDAAAQLRKQRRAVLALDLFQTGAAQAPRDRDDHPAVPEDPGTGGGPKFLIFNVTDDQARVQDVLTAIAYAAKTGKTVEVYARGDAAVWAIFAAAASATPVALHVEDVPRLASEADYVQHFNVPGILRAGGLAMAEKLAER
jgi:dienelactone hydrolase